MLLTVTEYQRTEKASVGLHMHKLIWACASVLPLSVAQLDVRPTGGLDPCWVWQNPFFETDYEISSTVILSVLLIQEVKLSVSGESKCTSTC